MVSKKSSLVIAAIVTISFFLSVAYVSCTKPLVDYKYSCNGVICSNGGHCDSAKCVCPVGFEGVHCETGTVDKFIGMYTMHSTVLGSDSLSLVGTDTTYAVLLRRSATPTTFFLDNFAGDPFYSSIVCTLDSNNLSHFAVDTISHISMVYDHYRIRDGQGTMAGNSILIYIRVRHLTPNVNWQNDTLRLQLNKDI